MRARSLSLLVLVLLAVVAGCGRDDDDSDAEPASAAPAATDTPALTLTPAPALTPTAAPDDSGVAGAGPQPPRIETIVRFPFTLENVLNPDLSIEVGSAEPGAPLALVGAGFGTDDALINVEYDGVRLPV